MGGRGSSSMSAGGSARRAVPSVGPISTRLDGTQRQVEWAEDIRDGVVVERGSRFRPSFNSGTNVTLPKSLCVKVVDPTTGEAIRRVTAMEGNKDFNGEQYVGARDAVASDGDIWNKVIFNCVNATEVKSNNAAGGIILVPQANSVTTMDHGCGWIVSNGTVNLTNEWYAFPGEDEPFERIKVYKVFTGLDEVDVAKVNKDFVVERGSRFRPSFNTNRNTEQLCYFIPFIATRQHCLSSCKLSRSNTIVLRHGTFPS